MHPLSGALLTPSAARGTLATEGIGAEFHAHPYKVLRL